MTETRTSEVLHSDEQLDKLFGALSNKTRREMLCRVMEAPCAIGDLAEPFEMSLPGVSKHLRVLEDAGLVERRIEGRVHRCTYKPASIDSAHEWLRQRREYWNERFDALEHFLEHGPTDGSGQLDHDPDSGEDV